MSHNPMGELESAVHERAYDSALEILKDVPIDYRDYLSAMHRRGLSGALAASAFTLAGGKFDGNLTINHHDYMSE